MSKSTNAVEHATSTEVATTVDSDMGAIVAQVEAMKAGGVGIFSSLPSNTFEAKLATANALANALPIDEHLGEAIELTNFVVQAVEVTNTDAATGVSRKVPATRIVLVAADGSAYAGVSEGVFKSLQNLTTIFGMPADWEQPIPVSVERVKGRNGFFYNTLKIGA